MTAGSRPAPDRVDCDGCAACCTVIGVKELEKAPYEPCSKARKGGLGGCVEYATRPAGCRSYECLYSMGFLAVSERPDRIGILVDAAKLDSQLALQMGIQALVVRETYPGAAETAEGRRFIDGLSAKHVLIITCYRDFEHRRMIGPARLLAKVQRFVANRTVS